MATPGGLADLPIEVDTDPVHCSADSGLTDMEFVDLYALNRVPVPLLTCVLCVSRVQELRSIESKITKYKWENGRRYHAYREGRECSQYAIWEKEANVLFALRSLVVYPIPNDEVRNSLALDATPLNWRLTSGSSKRITGWT